MNYIVKKIPCKQAKEYIIKNHYSHGCHNAPSPCFGLFENEELIGVLMFATPCSEAVRSSIFGVEYKNRVIELHRLHTRQCGVNITKQMAFEKGWKETKRGAKNRYIYILGSKKERKKYIKLCKYDLTQGKNVDNKC